MIKRYGFLKTRQLHEKEDISIFRVSSDKVEDAESTTEKRFLLTWKPSESESDRSL